MRVVLSILHAVLIAGTAASLTVPNGEGRGAYDSSFFEQHREHADAYIALVRVLSQFMGAGKQNTVSTIDVGCGHGLLVEAWRAAGISRSYCVEGSDEAKGMWPKEQEHYYQVLDLESARTIEATDFVTSFEVAEHLQPSAAGHFVSLLTMHRPTLVFFGAATPFQDQGKNPSHVNENTFEYWIEHFTAQGYRVDWSKTALARHQLVTLPDPRFAKAMMQAWWYPKNLLIFAPKEEGAKIDRALLAHPPQANMLANTYLNIGGNGEFGQMWRRDWSSFGKAFYHAQEELLVQQRRGVNKEEL